MSAKLSTIFREYLAEFTNEEIASWCNVHPEAVRNWRVYKNLPKVPSLKALVQKSDGALSYEIILGEFAARVK